MFRWSGGIAFLLRWKMLLNKCGFRPNYCIDENYLFDEDESDGLTMFDWHRLEQAHLCLCFVRVVTAQLVYVLRTMHLKNYNNELAFKCVEELAALKKNQQ